MRTKNEINQFRPEKFEILIRSDNPYKLTKLMIDDFRQDPVLAARWILGVEIPPHQRMRLRAMWRLKFFLDDSGISTGKDATAAMCAACRCVLFPDWEATFLARGIKQLANINKEYFIKWRATCPYFSNEVEKIYTPRGVMTVQFKNTSQAKMMAAGWDRDAKNLRSERWNELFLNEWHTYGNLEAIQKTAIGRVTRYHPGQEIEELKSICDPHITLMASAGYKWMKEYGLVQSWQKKIDEGNPLHGRQRWDYYDIPKKMRIIFTDEDVMCEMMDSLPLEDALVEVFGVWQHSSSDFYDSMEIEDCRISGMDVELKRMSDTAYYIAGVDVAKNRDDFTIVVIKYEPGKHPKVVYCFRGNGMKNWQMSGMIHYVTKIFRLNFILMDAGGGGLYIKEFLEDPIQTIKGVKTSCAPILTPRDFPVQGSIAILELFKWSKEYQSLYRYFTREFPGVYHDDGILDISHSMLRTHIETRTIDFPVSRNYNIDANVLDNLIKTGFESVNAATEYRIIVENIDNMLNELVGVKRKLKPDGSFDTTGKGFYKWVSVKKKDSAYALLYAFLGYKIFISEREEEAEDEDDDILVEDGLFFQQEAGYDPFDDSILYGDFE